MNINERTHYIFRSNNENESKLFGVVDPFYIQLPVMIIIIILIFVPILTSILIKYIKKIEQYVKSYNKLLIIMISDAIYDLQIMQLIGTLSFLNVSCDIEYKVIPEILRKVTFGDYIEIFVHQNSAIETMPLSFHNQYLHVAFYQNIYTLYAFLLIGFVILGLIELLMKILSRNKNNKIVSNETEDQQQCMTMKTNEFSNEIYRKCTLVGIKAYLMYNYFIRIYQITLCKVIIVSFLFIKDADIINVFFSAIFILFWIIGISLILILYFRHHFLILLSPKMILSHGAFYMNYRSSIKDVYSFIHLLLFAAVPLTISLFNFFPKMQIVLLMIIFLGRLLFVSINQPYLKMTRVLSESLTEGLIFCILLILFVITYFPELEREFIKYINLSLYGLLFVLRGYRSIVDYVLKLKDIIKVQEPKVFVEINHQEKRDLNKDIMMKNSNAFKPNNEIEAFKKKKIEKDGDIIEINEDQHKDEVYAENDYMDSFDKEMNLIQQENEANNAIHLEVTSRTNNNLMKSHEIEPNIDKSVNHNNDIVSSQSKQDPSINNEAVIKKPKKKPKLKKKHIKEEAQDRTLSHLNSTNDGLVKSVILK